MEHKKFSVHLMQKRSMAPLDTTTSSGGLQKSFSSKQEAMKFAEDNKDRYSKITIKCPGENDIVYE